MSAGMVGSTTLPLVVDKLPRLDVAAKQVAEGSSKDEEACRPRNWSATGVPWRWLEMVPASAWSAIVSACRAQTVIDLSLLAECKQTCVKTPSDFRQHKKRQPFMKLFGGRLACV